jgi:hypothetical protein
MASKPSDMEDLDGCQNRLYDKAVKTVKTVKNNKNNKNNRFIEFCKKVKSSPNQAKSRPNQIQSKRTLNQIQSKRTQNQASGAKTEQNAPSLTQAIWRDIYIWRARRRRERRMDGKVGAGGGRWGPRLCFVILARGITHGPQIRLCVGGRAGRGSGGDGSNSRVPAW